ncbi:ABC transporter transmembrane domain-containing protein [Furfurilactobacillus milii]|uniref:ATP-binding cassette domain-containing protein n=1 Tax=Furfurilactobacillus rossiae TaxID=231049 RepID=A0A7C9N753_9LACO|nr:ABC transporter ATP-binding protein [Furfurilactobacillus milii]MYV05206.1 ATP-binding cassette domain-containing protein [Furfurilactobacillus milii]
MWQVLVKPQKKLFSLFFLVTIIHAIVTTAYTLIIAFLTAYMTRKINMSFGQVVTITLLCTAFIALVNVIGGYLKGKVTNGAMCHLRRQIFERLMLTVDFGDRRKVGEKVALLTSKLDVVEQSYVNNFLLGLSLVMQFVLGILLGVVVDVRLTLIVISLDVPAILLPLITQRQLKRAKLPVLNNLDRYTSAITNWFSGLTTIKNFGREHTFINMHASISTDVKVSENHDILVRKVVSGISQFCGDLVYFGTWVVGGYFILNHSLTLAAFMTFTQLSVQISFPLETAADVFSDFFGGQRAYQQLRLVIEAVAQNNERLAQLPEQDDVFIDYVHATIGGADKDTRPLLKDVNLQINQSDKVIIIGDSGSGKSTLINALFGYRPLLAGSIFVDGRSPIVGRSADIAKMIGYQNQQTFIFDGTVRDNLTMFSDQYTDQELIDALNRAELQTAGGHAHTNAWLSMILHTQGGPLSGGERQRIGLARNLLTHKRFMIFDELSSGLDHKTAETIEKRLFRLNIGFIYITHSYNRSLLKAADKVFEVHDKRVTAVSLD